MTELIMAILPDLDDTSTGDDDPEHYICCDPDVAMCGISVAGQEWVDGQPDRTCRLCLYVDDEGLPCPVPGCPGGTRSDD
jgi:hypothetical protein